MNNKIKGFLLGAIAAICYGTNPLGALYLYEDGMNVNSVVFYRYLIAAIGLAIMMLLKKEGFKLNRKEFMIVLFLGILFAISSLALYDSFNYMEAGIACTLLFVYPIMVATIMSIFFKEKVRWTTIVSIGLALTGIILLYQGDGNETLNTWGVLLVMVSSLSYAIYIVTINRAKLNISSTKLTFYVMTFGVITVAIQSLWGEQTDQLQMINSMKQLGFSLMLGIVPTLISLVTMAMAIKYIGSTPTAILGALEPTTAVIIGVLIFDEKLTIRLVIGIVLILVAVTLIIIGNEKPHKKTTSRETNSQLAA